MTISASTDSIETAAKVVKLSSKDWKAIATLLIAATTLFCGVAYAVAGRVVESKVMEISSSSNRITALEKATAIMQVELAAQSKTQDKILTELVSISRDVKDVSQSVARIEGANSQRKQ